ncbi:MAG: hypothetical protein WBP58_02050 [Chitinophagaceae bacterium]
MALARKTIIRSTLLSELFEFVKSLTKSEKRYFKLYTQFQGGSKAYLHLFDIIEKMNSYDEGKIRTQFVKQYRVTHFPATKQYLFQQLIAALRSFGAYKDLDSDHTDMIETYKVLHYKGLHGQSAKLLKRIKAITWSDDAFIRHYYVLLQEYLQEIYHITDPESSGIREIFEERKKVLQIIQNYSWVGDVFTLQRIFLRNKLYCRSAEDKAALRKIIAPLLKTRESDMLSRTALGMRNMALCDYYTAMGMFGKAFETSRIYLELRENAGRTDKVDTQTIAEYAQHLWLAVRAGRYDDFDVHLERYKHFVDEITNHDKHALAFERWYLFSLIRFCRQGRFDEATRLQKDQQKTIVQFEASFTMKGKITIWYFHAYRDFARADYRKALQMIQKIQLEANDEVEEYSFSKLLLMFIQYELGNHELLSYQVRSAQRFMEKQGRMYTCERALMGFFKSVEVAANKTELRKQLMDLKEQMTRIFKVPHERGFLFFIDVESWVNAQLAGKNFAEVVGSKR